MADPLESTVRASLEEDREQLKEQLAEFDGAAFDENFADSGQVAAEQGEAQSLANSLREQLDAVEQALAKLDDGTYGLCERCQQPIPDARLEAMPASRFCIEHANG
jgi:RNA polymerase-binding transcription factor DksA